MNYDQVEWILKNIADFRDLKDWHTHTNHFRGNDEYMELTDRFEDDDPEVEYKVDAGYCRTLASSEWWGDVYVNKLRPNEVAWRHYSDYNWFIRRDGYDSSEFGDVRGDNLHYYFREPFYGDLVFLTDEQYQELNEIASYRYLVGSWMLQNDIDEGDLIRRKSDKEVFMLTHMIYSSETSELETSSYDEVYMNLAGEDNSFSDWEKAEGWK